MNLSIDTSVEPKPNVGVQQPVEVFRTSGQLRGIAIFEGFGERAEERSHITFLEHFMAWLAPFVKPEGMSRLLHTPTSVARMIRP